MTARLPLLGVSACLFRGAQVLLVERGRAPFAGKLSLPGGKVEFGERLVGAVRREVHEETGLLVADLDFFRLHEALGGDFHAVIAVFTGRFQLSSDATPAPGDDALSIRFMDVRALPELQAQGLLTDGLAALAGEAYRQRQALGSERGKIDGDVA